MPSPIRVLHHAWGSPHAWGVLGWPIQHPPGGLLRHRLPRRDARCRLHIMGFTPLEGLVMATRSGAVDSALVLWLAREQGLSRAVLDSAL